VRDFLAKKTRMRVQNSLKIGHLFENEGFFGKGNSKASAKLPKNKFTPKNSISPKIPYHFTSVSRYGIITLHVSEKSYFSVTLELYKGLGEWMSTLFICTLILRRRRGYDEHCRKG